MFAYETIVQKGLLSLSELLWEKSQLQMPFQLCWYQSQENEFIWFKGYCKKTHGRANRTFGQN